MNYEIVKGETSIATGASEQIREKLECIFEDMFGKFVMFQEDVEENELELYLHTDSYDMLENEDLKRLSNLGITDDISTKAICKYLNISILNVPTEKADYDNFLHYLREDEMFISGEVESIDGPLLLQCKHCQTVYRSDEECICPAMDCDINNGLSYKILGKITKQSNFAKNLA